jgi:hypothetical protein
METTRKEVIEMMMFSFCRAQQRVQNLMADSDEDCIEFADMVNQLPESY